jgi:hypothetical protein
MRLWSLHPSLLDRAGLCAVWREGLLAQKVLLGETVGYRAHPQLRRFREAKDPVAAIGAYLWGVVEEAEARGYRFDASKIVEKKRRISMLVTDGQLQYELQHLSRKLQQRDPDRLGALREAGARPHPMLRVVAGGVADWEAIR